VGSISLKGRRICTVSNRGSRLMHRCCDRTPAKGAKGIEDSLNNSRRHSAWQPMAASHH
jgi:hypothetical protein